MYHFQILPCQARNGGYIKALGEEICGKLCRELPVQIGIANDLYVALHVR